MDLDNVFLVKLADGQCEDVDRVTATVFSSCARGLPQDAEAWDVSQFQIDGQPVQRETVVAWLNVAYRLIHGRVFEGQLSNPARSATGLAQLLAFADAVGSSRGMLHALDADATCLTAEVQLAGQQPLTLELSMGNSYSLDAWLQNLVTQIPHGGKRAAREKLNSLEGQAALKQQFASQVEQLLHLAYKLQLPLLKKSLHKVILSNSYQQSPLLNAKAMDSIVSERVLAACDQHTSRPALLNSLTTQLLASGNKWHCLMRPKTKPCFSDNVLAWTTELEEDFLCYPKGGALEVFMHLFPSTDKGPRLLVKRLGVQCELNVQLRFMPWASSSTEVQKGA